MNDHLTDNKLEKRLHELREQVKLYAKAEADRIYLENYKHSKLAILMKTAELNGATSVAAQDRDARAHPEYLELLDGLRSATNIAEENKWLLRVAMQGSSLYQTQQAGIRAELQAYQRGSST